MSRKFVFPILLVVVLVMSACSLPGFVSTVVSPTGVVKPPVLTAAAATLSAFTPVPPAATATPLPLDTSVPVPTATVASVPYPASADQYIDDRSTPSQVIVSFYNAIDRHEYLRAYSYWDDPSNSVGSYAAFAAGYQDTASVDLVFGPINGDPGMSQVYYTIPVVLKVTLTNNTHTNYAACYVVHETTPEVYGAPPFGPMGIYQGSAQPSNLAASDDSVLASACGGSPTGGNLPFPAFSSSLSIDKDNFLDNRSGPVETVSSFLNALNRKQYVRAYYYFQDPANFPGPYDPWAAGYSNTDVITVTFGTVQSEGAAGSLYYKVPLATHVTTTSNATQTFVGCYTLRLAQPAVQGTPPFQPMGIIDGTFTQVSNSADVNALLPTACH
jgi:hypothetical protein